MWFEKKNDFRDFFNEKYIMGSKNEVMYLYNKRKDKIGILMSKMPFNQS